ncbi:MAG: hypothetical protein RLZZ184_3231 [Cyanobacteriota bacterium]|jgi:hypothetical protein
MKALQRPDYLSKTPEQKFWKVQVEYVFNKERCCSVHIFDCPVKAAGFARSKNTVFDSKDFFYSTVEKMKRKRGVKHF